MEDYFDRDEPSLNHQRSLRQVLALGRRCSGRGRRLLRRFLSTVVVAGIRTGALHSSDTIAQRQRDTLCLRANADVATEFAVLVLFLLHRDVHKRVLTEDGFGVEVGGEEIRCGLLLSEVK